MRGGGTTSKHQESYKQKNHQENKSNINNSKDATINNVNVSLADIPSSEREEFIKELSKGSQDKKEAQEEGRIAEGKIALTLNEEFIQIRDRLKFILKCVNQYSFSDNRFTITKCGELLDNRSVLLLFSEKTSEFPIELLDIFSEYFCINSKWLKFGEESPYGDYNNSEAVIENPRYSFDPTEIIPSIEILNPEAIYFVMFQDGENINGYIIVKLSEFRFKRVSHYAPLDVEHAGSNGKEQLRNLVKICKHFYNQSRVGCFSLIFKDEIDKDLLNQFQKGQLWLGFVEEKLFSHHHSDWADDICDYNTANSVTQDYEMLYGEWFLRTREHLKKCMKN